MKITLRRFKQTSISTFGMIFIDGVFQCFTLEDIHRDVKVMDKTRIPNGFFSLSIANWGTLNTRYKTKFGDKHKGMIMIDNVPNFTGILFHMGINANNSSGCVLVGSTPDIQNDQILQSEIAYLNFYSKVMPKLIAKEKVEIAITDEVFFT